MKIHLSAPFVLVAVCASLGASPATTNAQQAASSSTQTATSARTISPEVIPHRGTRRNVISMQEIIGAKARDAYELVSRMRPLWLRQRGASSLLLKESVLVYWDGMRFGGPESLRQIDANSVGSIRFLNGVQATAELGTGHGNGVIMVKTRM